MLKTKDANLHHKCPRTEARSRTWLSCLENDHALGVDAGVHVSEGLR